jgi:hypothetical protein
VGSKAGLDVCGKSHPHRDSIPGPSGPCRVAILTEPLSPTFKSKHYVSEFNVYGSVHRRYIPIYIQQDATLHILFISGNCSTCFGWYHHPSSWAQTIVSTASGTNRNM